jgi:hypothetical protein
VYIKFTVYSYLLSPCIVMCEIYLVSSIAILFVFIVSNIGNEWNVILINGMINILLFLDINYKFNWGDYNFPIVIQQLYCYH